jgi:hypothetical protein
MEDVIIMLTCNICNLVHQQSKWEKRDIENCSAAYMQFHYNVFISE